MGDTNKRLETLPAGLLKALRNREHTDEEILAMSAAKMFDEYCEWHGLAGWGSELRYILAAATKHTISKLTRQQRRDIIVHLMEQGGNDPS